MITRRQFATGSMTLGASSLRPACAPGSSGSAYDAAARDIWRHGQVDCADSAAVRRELVRYATLAPSSHNTQYWKFTIANGAITIAPDLARRCRAVDPDDHQLFVSLGYAAEHLVQAALAHGLKHWRLRWIESVFPHNVIVRLHSRLIVKMLWLHQGSLIT